jgi:serine/tyrosine/threonine adenylyltransferase
MPMNIAQKTIVAGPDAPAVAFDNSYARDLDGMYIEVAPTRVSAPKFIRFNEDLAAELGMKRAGVSDEALAAIFSGNLIPAGAQPLAMAYAGHQFGHFVPQLGDGRAILLGEVIDRDGRRRDIQLKGSGITPFSRRGDGRAALGPVLREYIVSEAMHALGVPTTRALAAVATGERVQREKGKPGAVFTRVAASHLRVGTFQFFAARGDFESVRKLADYAIERHYPAVMGSERRYADFLASVIEAQAKLIAHWMSIGFIHGVMNTDNMTISGESIDFGPCAFLDNYLANKVFSSIDEYGRYAYSNQPKVAQWNLARLAETLVPLLDEDEEKAVGLANELISEFSVIYDRHYLERMGMKLGLRGPQQDDTQLIADWQALMEANAIDFTNGFRGLPATVDCANLAAFRDGFTDLAAFDAWHQRWLARLAGEASDAVNRMIAANPKYIPRNHRIEQAIRAAEDEGDFAPFHELVEVLKNPYAEQREFERYTRPPLEGEEVLRTFCGT